jgi:hypothetical protein
MGSFECLDDEEVDAGSGRMIDVRVGMLRPPVETGGYKILDVKSALLLDIYRVLNKHHARSHDR